MQQNPNATGAGERRSAAINQEHFLQWRARMQTLSHLAAFERHPMMLTGRANPVRLPSARMSAAMFPMRAGIEAALDSYRQGRVVDAKRAREIINAALGR